MKGYTSVGLKPEQLQTVSKALRGSSLSDEELAQYLEISRLMEQILTGEFACRSCGGKYRIIYGSGIKG
ncbi:MAG: hypothetical protein JWN18_395 [Parcubacteria group bacterium]|nr:hypothetical protein [Parcubacteria group bacterium]